MNNTNCGILTTNILRGTIDYVRMRKQILKLKNNTLLFLPHLIIAEL